MLPCYTNRIDKNWCVPRIPTTTQRAGRAPVPLSQRLSHSAHKKLVAVLGWLSEPRPLIDAVPVGTVPRTAVGSVLASYFCLSITAVHFGLQEHYRKLEGRPGFNRHGSWGQNASCYSPDSHLPKTMRIASHASFLSPLPHTTRTGAVQSHLQIPSRVLFKNGCGRGNRTPYLVVMSHAICQ